MPPSGVGSCRVFFVTTSVLRAGARALAETEEETGGETVIYTVDRTFSDVSGVERSDEEAAEEGLDLEVTARLPRDYHEITT